MLPFIDLTPAQKLIFLAKATGIGNSKAHDITGNPVVFETDLAKNMKKLKVNFLPMQASGTPAPDNVLPIYGWGELNVFKLGENLLSINRTTGQTSQGIVYTPIRQNNKTVAVHVEGQRTNTNPFFNLNYVDGSTKAIAPGTYKISGGTPRVRLQVFYKDSGGTERIAGYDSGDGATVTIPDDATASWCRLLVTVDTPVAENVYPIIAADNAVINSYPVVFPAHGENLGTFVNGKGINSSGEVYDESQRCATVIPIPIVPGMSYIFTAEGGAMGIIAVFNGGTLVRRQAVISSGSVIDTSGGDNLYVCIYKPNEAVTVSGNNPQVRHNTIYGGALDVVSGVLTVDRKRILLSDIEWSYNESGYFYAVIADKVETKTSGDGTTYPVFCSMLAYGGVKTGSQFADGGIYQTYYSKSLYIKDSECTTPEELSEKYGTADIVYCLSSPQTVTFTPEQITALVGDNTVWSNANGIIEVTYLKKS